MAAAAAAAADLYYHPDDREQEFGCDLDNDDPPPLPDDFIINSEEWADLDKAGRRKIAADRLDAVLKKKAENRRKELARLRQQKFRATGHQNERTLPCPNEGCSRKFGTNAAVTIHSKKCEHFRPTGSASANTNASGAGVGVDAARTPGGGGSVDDSGCGSVSLLADSPGGMVWEVPDTTASDLVTVAATASPWDCDMLRQFGKDPTLRGLPLNRLLEQKNILPTEVLNNRVAKKRWRTAWDYFRKQVCAASGGGTGGHGGLVDGEDDGDDGDDGDDDDDAGAGGAGVSLLADAPPGGDSPGDTQQQPQQQPLPNNTRAHAHAHPGMVIPVVGPNDNGEANNIANNAIANGAVAGASSRRSSPRWQQPHATGAAASSARPNTRGSARAGDDLRHQYDTVVNMPGVAPLIKMYKDAGVEVPRNWPPGLIFTGKFNVLTWPSYDTVLKWLLNNKPQLNKKVEIKPSPGRGMGLFAAKNLRRNEEVGYYSGILREQRKTHATEYALKFDPEGKEGDDEHEIDAEHGGNEMRFANHPFKNEEENMKTKYSKRGSHPSHRVVVFTTTKDVKKGDELLWDYGPDYFEEG